MKKILLLLTILLASCSSFNKSRTIASSEMDLLKDESYSRFTLERLESISTEKISQSQLQLCHQGKVDSALDNLKNHLADQKDSAEYWNAIGVCYLLNNDTQKSYFYFNIALTKSKNKKVESQITNNIAITLYKMQHFAQAYTLLEKAIKLDKSAVTPLYNKALINLKFGQTKEAINIFASLHQKNPKDQTIISTLASAYVLNNNINKSVKYFRLLTIDQTKNPFIAFYYSYALSKSGESNKALEIFNSRERSGDFEFKLVAKKMKKFLESNSRG